MPLRKFLFALSAALLLTGAGAAQAALTPIDVTWNPSAAGITSGGPYTFDDIITNTFSNIDIIGNNFTETGYLRLSVFTNDNVPIAAPSAGFPGGSPYSLYINFTATGTQLGPIPGSPVPAFGQFSSLTYTLFGAPGVTNFIDSNNDGVFEASGASPVTLATGSLLSPGSTAITIDPVSGLLLPSAELTASLVPNQSFAAFFVAPPATTALSVVASATNTGTRVTVLPLDNGIRLVLDGGGGNLTVAGSLAPVPEPEQYALMMAGLALIGFVARRRPRETEV